MDKAEFSELNSKISHKQNKVRSKKWDLLDAHFKKYPWGILIQEAVTYLANEKVNGTYLSDEVLAAISLIEKEGGPDIFRAGKFISFKRRMINHFRGLCDEASISTSKGTTLAEMLQALGITERDTPVEKPTSLNAEISVRKALADPSDYPLIEGRRTVYRNHTLTILDLTKSDSGRTYTRSPIWKELYETLLSAKFVINVGNILPRIGDNSIFFGKDIIQVWARLFFEIETDWEDLKTDDSGLISCAGCFILKALKDTSRSRDSLRDCLVVRPQMEARLDEYLGKLCAKHLANHRTRQHQLLTPAGMRRVNVEEYYLTKRAKAIFFHLGAHMGQGEDPEKWPDEDLRRWRFRRDIVYPPLGAKKRKRRYAKKERRKRRMQER